MANEQSLEKLWKFYRGMALLVGTVLAILVFIAMPYRYLIAGVETTWYALAWQAHGYIFPVYVIATFLLSQKLKWNFTKIGLVMIAGTVPLMSFFVERRIAQEIKTH